MHLLVDMDGIVVDTLKKWLGLYNDEWKQNLSAADISTYDVHLCVVPECGKKIYKYIDQPGFFADVPPIEGAASALEKFKKAGHEITLVTAPSNSPTCHGEKVTWVKNNLPFLSDKDLIMAHKKYILSGDVLIDDRPSNLSEFRAYWPKGKTVAIGYPYNEAVKNVVDHYADGHSDFAAAWKSIENYIARLETRDRVAPVD